MAPLPVLTAVHLSEHTGRPQEEFGTYVLDAIKQATFLLLLRTGISEQPTDPVLAELVRLARLDVAYRLYLERQFIEVKSNPFSSETIGSYSYSKSQASISASSRDRPSGIFWWDLLLEYLADLEVSDDVESGAITVFENDGVVIESGRRRVIGPLDIDYSQYPYDVNTQVIHDPNRSS